MRRMLWLVCLCLCIPSIGCFKWLEDARRDDGHISKMGGSTRARQIENELDWAGGSL